MVGTGVELDAREGGRCIERMTVDGSPYQREGSVTHYDLPEKLVLTLRNDEPNLEPALEQISISLTDLDDRTLSAWIIKHLVGHWIRCQLGQNK